MVSIMIRCILRIYLVQYQRDTLPSQPRQTRSWTRRNPTFFRA